MTTSLTERYIGATVASLPPTAQEDVRAELEGSIADAVDARLDQGEDPGDAERAVLTELGDPAALAAGYADRPLHLLGPRYYLAWKQLLKILLMIVPACAVVGVALAQVIAGASVGAVIGQAVGVGVTATMHLFFWVTLVFVLLERTGADTGPGWTVDQLREPTSTGTGRADLIASLILAAAGAGALLWDHFLGFFRVDGVSLPILHPGLWPWAMAGLLALIALEAVLAVMLFANGRWSVRLAVLNTVLAVLAMTLVLTLLGNGLLLNPDFLQTVFIDNGVEPDSMRVLGILTWFMLVGIPVWDILDGWLKTRRDALR
ncbi:permease prefix domain 1-containing protein [Brachybacterium tyrofermentans]|uniref:Permease prefix domain 1-containing protein n=1 Tax=Brachybacterium tyrofermentans TaxID=47848 RepID=A0ABW0FKB8_9MICO